MPKYSLVMLGMIVGLLVTVAAGWYYLDQNYTYHGVLIDPPAPAADFQLNDQYGNPFRLSQQQGKVVLLFFGYTNCPDVCPTTLSAFKKIKTLLGKHAGQVNFVFITVDPERDSPERIAAYLAGFDPTFIGLSAGRAVLEPVWKSYGVYQERKDSASAAGYLVDHSAYVYAIDTQGRWRINFPFGMDANKIARDVLRLLRE